MNNLIIAQNYETFGEEGLTSNKVIYYKDDNMVKFRANITDNPFGESEVVTVGGSEDYYSLDSATKVLTKMSAVDSIQLYDYLQNDGVAYIDTEIKNIVNTEIELVAQQTELNSGGYFTLLGANETADTFKVIFVYGSAVFYSQPTARGNSTIIGDIDTDKHTFKANLKTNDVTFGFDNTTITDSYAITNTTTYSLYLFARNNRGRGANGNSKMKVYSLKVKDNGKLIKDFRPCIYNDEAGLWELVENKFYGNANSTGTLTVGNDE